MKNILIGRTITGMQIATDKKALRFETDQGEVIARADGDCCSETWIEYVDPPARGFPALVSTVEDLDLPGSRDEGYDYIQVYGCKIVTDKGDIAIDFRNSSNGYYGGNLAWPGDYFYGGVYGQNISENKWQEITAASS